MTFEYADKQYRITFKHDTRYALPTDPNVMVKGTQCDIEKSQQSAPYCRGYSYCHPNDNFCRETGRKLALTKALRYNSRAFRTAAWKAYLGRPRGEAQQYLDQLLRTKNLTAKTVAKARQKLLVCYSGRAAHGEENHGV